MSKISLAAIVDRLRTDTEFSQTIVRFPIGVATLMFTYVFGYNDPIGASTLMRGAFGPIFAASWLMCWLLIAWSWHKPGNFWYRRIAGMLLDLFCLWGLLTMGGQILLPVYLGLVWVIVGNGLRYGYRYLTLAMFGGISIVIYLYLNNSYWHANPIMAATFGATLVVAPTYALSLMGQLRRANVAVLLAAGQRSKLLAQASHDLRHPLHALRLFSRQLDATSLSDDQRALLVKIDMATANANQMLQQFLDQSIVESGILRLRPENIKLSDLVKEVTAQNETWLAASCIQVTTIGLDHIIETDRNVLRTILQGLMSNTIKYAAGGRLLIGARRHGANCFLHFYDQQGGSETTAVGEALDIDSAAQLGLLPQSTGVGLGLAQNLASQGGYQLVHHFVDGVGSHVAVGPFKRYEANSGSSSEKALAITPLSGMRISTTIANTALRERVQRALEGWGCQEAPPTSTCLAHISDTYPLGQIRAPVILIDVDRDADLERSLGEPDKVYHLQSNKFSQLRSVLMSLRSKTPAEL